MAPIYVFCVAALQLANILHLFKLSINSVDLIHLWYEVEIVSVKVSGSKGDLSSHIALTASRKT
jgi:hypothetical protein